MNNDLRVILDCMTGADGGISFANLKVFVGEMERRVKEESDQAAHEVLQVISRFRRLIDVATGDLR